MEINMVALEQCQREIDQAMANIAFALTATVEQLTVLNQAYARAKGVIAGHDLPPL